MPIPSLRFSAMDESIEFLFESSMPADSSSEGPENTQASKGTEKSEPSTSTDKCQPPKELATQDSDDSIEALLMKASALVESVPELPRMEEPDKVWHSTPPPRGTRPRPARKIPGPAGYLHAMVIPEEVDPDVKRARAVLKSGAWRAMREELKFRGFNPESSLAKWSLKSAAAKDTNRPFKIWRLIVAVVARVVDLGNRNPILVLVDDTGTLDVNISEQVMLGHGDQIVAGSIVVMERVVIRISYDSNVGVASTENFVCIYSPEKDGFRAKFLKDVDQLRLAHIHGGNRPDGEDENGNAKVPKISKKRKSDGDQAGSGDGDNDADAPSEGTKAEKVKTKKRPLVPKEDTGCETQ